MISLRFGLLGSLEVTIGGRPVQIAGPRQRSVLAALALRAGHVVSVDRLVDVVWAESPPATAVAQIQTAVSALRRAVGDVIRTRSPGYLLDVPPDRIDVHLFEAHIARARSAIAAGNADHARQELSQALDLWRGRALADVPGLAAEADVLEEHRLTALEERFDIELGAGRHAEVIPDLVALTTEQPLRERFRAQLMLALHRCDRQAEALDVYRDTRRVLIEELGIEPGAALQALERSILKGDPSLDPPRPIAGTSQLPPDIDDFTGRDTQLAEIRCQLSDDDRQGPGIAVITGPAGVGKTALAVHAAHLERSSFPDGQLYVDLRGVEPNPREPRDVLGLFLRFFGLSGHAVPEDIDERIALYRCVTSDRSVLVVLDNAGDEQQIRPLLPVSSTSAVIVTSRARLTGLSGARHLELEVLPANRCIELLGRIGGPDRIGADPSAAARLIRLCGELPLAVRIAGARLAARPHWTVQGLTRRLADERQRLAELSHGDLDVAASLALSYHGLGTEHQRAFRLFALLDCASVPVWAAASLFDRPVAATEDLLDGLVDARLLEVRDSGTPRYGMHDLVRVFARERAGMEDAAPTRHAAVERVLGAWLAAARHAEEQSPHGYFGSVRSTAERGKMPPELVVEVTDDPFGWLDGERSTLAAVVEQAARDGYAAYAWELADALNAYYEVRGHTDDWRRTHEVALSATRSAGDTAGEAAMLRGLAELHAYVDDVPTAIDHFERAEQLFVSIGAEHGQAVCASGLGHAHRLQGRYDEAVRRFEHAAAVAGRLDQCRTEAYARHGMGLVHLDQGRLTEAARCFEAALTLARLTGFRAGEAQSLRGLGLLLVRRAQLDDAADTLAEAASISRLLGSRVGQAGALQALADVRISQGRIAEARGLLAWCIKTHRDCGEHFGVALCLHTLGRSHLSENALDDAKDCLDRAVRKWSELELPLWEARTLELRGTVREAAGEPDEARRDWAAALGRYRQVGAPEAEAVAWRLGL